MFAAQPSGPGPHYGSKLRKILSHSLMIQERNCCSLVRAGAGSPVRGSA